MVKTDLHTHTCLSPCADDRMTPRELVRLAKKAGLDLIALTDHNTANNCPAVAAAAREAGLGFIPGIEVTTMEEIHCVCLFADLGKAAAFSCWLDTRRPNFTRRPAIFNRKAGPGLTRRWDDRELLFMARQVSVDELYRETKALGGLFWPAHVDKPSNSLYSILGCWPEDFKADAVELYNETEPPGIPAGLKRIRCSDAHRPWDMDWPGWPMPLETPDFEGLKAYLLPDE